MGGAIPPIFLYVCVVYMVTTLLVYFYVNTVIILQILHEQNTTTN